MKKPLLSVCLITYNHKKYIREAIDGVLAQQVNFTWELVIADDYSTDGTREILLEYQKKHPDFIKLILQKKNVGAERNWLDLIGHPKSKYIAYLEGDDYWSDITKLQTQVDFLEKNSDYVLCFHPTRVFFENGEEQDTVWPKIDSKTTLTTEKLLKENFIPSNSVVYRRQDYSQLPLGVMPGDWFLHLYHAQFGKIKFINKVMSSYRRHEGGIWWGTSSGEDVDEVWKKYGIGHLILYSELLKIYGDVKKYRHIIDKYIYITVDTLSRIDSHSNTRLIQIYAEEHMSGNEMFIALSRSIGKMAYEHEKSIDIMRKQIFDLQVHNELLQKQKKDIIDSLSWKVTKPLRVIKKNIATRKHE